jgi:hypothetical protein
MEGAKKKNGISGNMAEVQIYTWSFNAISPWARNIPLFSFFNILTLDFS